MYGRYPYQWIVRRFGPKAAQRLFTAFAVLLLAFFTGCGTFIGDAFYFNGTVTNQEKSRILTDKAIGLYKTEIEVRENYARLPDIREMLTAALRFDPANARADEYLGKIGTYRSDKVKERIKAIENLKAKKALSDEDQFLVAFYSQKLYELDPDDANVRAIRDGNREARESLVRKYMAEGAKLRGQIKPGDPDDVKQMLALQALDQYERTLRIDPESGQVREAIAGIRAELAMYFGKKADLFAAKVKVRDYPAAASVLQELTALNAKLDKIHDGDLRDMTYALNYPWAAALLSQNQYFPADQKIKAALAANRTQEALALKAKVDYAMKTVGQEQFFNDTLKDLDSLLNQGSLVQANNRLQVLYAQFADQAKVRLLDQRKSRLQSGLPDMYSQAVQYFNAEDFKKSVELFDVIVQVNPDYEQAKSYLENARSKQALLENY
jgi:hypothetical protein